MPWIPCCLHQSRSPKDIDVAYFALSSAAREKWMKKMITIPIKRRPQRGFHIAGGRFRVDLGNAQYAGDLTYSEYREFCCRSLVNLNITSWTHATARGTSTSRPFELAAFGSCIVSHPYDGIEARFEPEKEISIVHDEREAAERYEQLLDNPEDALDMGRRARERVLREHTYRQRAADLIRYIEAAN